MTENEAITRIRYRIDTATDIAGNGIDGKAYEDMEIAIKVLEEIQKYQIIGTVDECLVAREKQREVKPIFEINYGDYESRFACACGKRIVVRHNRGVMDNNNAPNYCPNCGQKLDWTE